MFHLRIKIQYSLTDEHTEVFVLHLMNITKFRMLKLINIQGSVCSIYEHSRIHCTFSLETYKSSVCLSSMCFSLLT
jgi:hypothetical protein